MITFHQKMKNMKKNDIVLAVAIITLTARFFADSNVGINIQISKRL